MPYGRVWEITRYYRYVGGEKVKDRRAFEVRIYITVPEDWDAEKVQEYVEDQGLIREIDDFVERELTRKFEIRKPYYIKEGKRTVLRKDWATQALVDVVTAEPEYGQLPEAFWKSPIDSTKPGYRRSPVTGFAYSDPVYYPPTAPMAREEWKTLRAQLGGFSKEKKDLERRRSIAEMVGDFLTARVLGREIERVDERIKDNQFRMSLLHYEPLETEEKIEYTLVDKTRRYRGKFRGRDFANYPVVSRGTLRRKWRIPWEE